MKIIFIEPRGAAANVYTSMPMPLLGPVYLATILKNHGHEVEIYNEKVYTPDYSTLKADIIGISILTSTAHRGYEIAKKFPKNKVIIGGIHASLLPEEALQYCRQVVIGEADNVILDIVEGRLTEKIIKGKIVENLNTLPLPDFSLIKGFNPASGIIPVSTSRGCPFDCSFCTVTKLFGRKYRFREAESVITELLNTKAKQVFFCDDNFTADNNRINKLLNLLIKNKITNWSCQVRCEIAKNEKLLKLMKQAGCRVVCVGFESVNPKSLEDYEKKLTLDQIISSIRSFRKQKIRIHGMFVIGSESDSIKTIWDTLKFIVKQRIDTMQMMILTPFPGTKVYDHLEKEKRIFSKNWSLYDGHHIVYKPKLLSPLELQKNVFKAYKKFYTLSRSFRSLINWKITNAFLHLVGFIVVKKWRAQHRGMDWLKNCN